MRIAHHFRLAATAVLLFALAPTPALASGGFDSCLGYAYSNDAIAGGGLRSTCIRAFAEGRAAVLLPKAGTDIDDVAAARDGQLHAWGFLDGDGQLVIKPQFDFASDFHNGYAAVVQDELWGFIDRAGDWAIQPRYPKLLTDFTAAGLALVVDKAGRYQVIDSRGQVVSDDDIATAKRVTLAGGQPSRVTIDYGARYLNASGERVRIPAGIDIRAAFGDNGWRVAYAESVGAYGVLARAMAWVIKPQFLTATAVADGNALLVQTAEDRYAIVTPNGDIRPIGEGIHRGDFWLSRNADTFDMYWQQGRPIAEFSLSSQTKLYRLYPFLGVGTDVSLKIYARNGDQPVSVNADWTPILISRDAPLLALTANRSIQALLTINGTLLSAANDNSWVSRVDADNTRYQYRHIWLFDSDYNLLQVIDRHGRPLLQAEKIGQLAGHDITPIMPVPHDDPVAIAFVQQPHCGCGDSNTAGLLLGDGTVVLHADWYRLTSMNPDWQPRYRSELTHLPANARFRVQTMDNHFGIVDARGQIVVKPTLDKLNDYVGAYVLGYSAGQPVIFDRAGQQHEAPKLFQASLVGDGLLSYTDSALVKAGHKLFDIKSSSDVGEQQFKHIAAFRHGQARALSTTGQYGVIDRHGNWIIPAQYAQLQRVGGNLWQVGLAAEDDPDGSRTLLGPDGSTLVSTDQFLHISSYINGLTAVEVRATQYGNAEHSWLLAADGKTILEGSDYAFNGYGDWVQVTLPTMVGFMAADGSWAMPPQTANIGVFHAASGLALRSGDAQTPDALVDVSGDVVATLPDDKRWQWPLTSAWPYRIGLHKNDYVTTYANTQGDIVARVDGYGGGFANGQAIVSRGDKNNGPFTWLDAKGNSADDIRFTILGRLVDRRVGERAVAGYSGGVGVIDAQGRFVVPPVFSAVNVSAAGIVAADDRESMILDANGRPVVRVIRRCGIRILYDAGRQPIWPRRLPQDCPVAP